MDYKKIVKYLLVIPMLVGAIELLELALPLQKVNDVVDYKEERINKGFTSYNIYFANHNDQFTETIYKQLKEYDEVELEVTYFTKEVRHLVIEKSQKRLDNDTSEVYIQTAMALAMFVFSIMFFIKEYLNSFNFKIAIFLVILGLASLIRIISIN